MLHIKSHNYLEVVFPVTVTGVWYGISVQLSSFKAATHEHRSLGARVLPGYHGWRVEIMKPNVCHVSSDV